MATMSNPVSVPAKFDPSLRAHLSNKGKIWYFPERWQAVEFAHETLDHSRFAFEYRVVEYTVGHAIQLHKSGEYLGPHVDVKTHRCAWCEGR